MLQSSPNSTNVLLSPFYGLLPLCMLCSPPSGVLKINLYERTHTALSWSSFKSLRNRYHNLILTSKKQYYSNLIFAVSDNPRRLWQTVNKLLCRKSASTLPIGNELPTDLREPRQIQSPLLSPITHGSSSSSSSLSSLSPLASSLTRPVFHSELKTSLFGKSFPPQTFSFPTGLILQTIGPFNVFILLNSWIFCMVC